MKKQILGIALALCTLLSVFSLALSANADAATEIGTKAELLALMSDSAAWGGSYILTADIDLAGDAAQAPIGNTSVNFTGSFNGDGHTVSGLSLGDTQGQNLGLFGVINGARIENLTVEGTIETTVGIRIGGIAGVAKDTAPSKIKNCTSRVNIHTTASGIAGIGGILGRLDCTDTSSKTKAHWEISGCKNEGAVSCSTTYTGGVVGIVSAVNKSGDYAQVDIYNNWNAGTVTAAQRPAGIASFVRPGGTRLFLIHDNLNTGNVTCSGGTAAGIVAAGNTSITSAQKAYKIYNNFNAGSIVSTQGTPTLIHPLIAAVTSACTASDMTNNFYSSADTYTTDATTAYETAVSLETVATDAAALGSAWVLTNGRTPELAVFHQHTKAYADEGDGTHSITCYCGHVEYSTHVYENGNCTLCGAEEPACAHTHTHDDVTLAATCRATGLKNVVCNDCGNTLQTDVEVALDASNHDGNLVLGYGKNGADEIDYCCDACGAVVTVDTSSAAHVYVSSAGREIDFANVDAGNLLGTSTNPFLNMTDAMQYAAYSARRISGGVTVHILDSASFPTNYISPACAQMITVTGGTLTFANRFIQSGPVTFKDIVLHNTIATVFAARCHKIVIGEGVSMQSGHKDFFLCGAFEQNAGGTVPAGGYAGDVTIRSGEWTSVFVENRAANTGNISGDLTAFDAKLTVGKTKPADTLSISTSLSGLSDSASQFATEGNIVITIDGDLDVTGAGFYPVGGKFNAGGDYTCAIVLQAAPGFKSISDVNSSRSTTVVYADHTADGAAALADAIVSARGAGASLGYLCDYIGSGHIDANEDNACDKCGKLLAYVGTPLSLSGVYTDAAGKLRFVTKVMTGEDDPEIEYFGTYLVPLSYFNDNELTAAGGEQPGVAQVKYTQGIESGLTFAADLVDIPAGHYDTEIFAWSFIKFAGIDTVYTETLGVYTVNGATFVKGGF